MTATPKLKPCRGMNNRLDVAILILREFLGVRSLNGHPFDGASLVPALNVLEAAGNLTKDDKGWLKCRVDWAIPEYTPAIDGMVCPGKAMKDRFNALLSALPDPVDTGAGKPDPEEKK
jgi:hypothetical protein